MYKTSQIANMLQVSQMTISRWVTKEFSSFFPDTAKVERGASRRFTDEEVSKLTLIATMRKEGHGLDAIEKALSEGDRGTLVNPQTNALAPVNQYQLTIMQDRIEELELEVERLRNAEAQNELLKEQNAALQTEIKALNREIGRLEASKGSE